MKDKGNSLRGFLEELYYDAYQHCWSCGELVRSIEKDIKRLLKRKLPHRKTFNSQAKTVAQSKRDAKIYNQALHDSKKAIDNA